MLGIRVQLNRAFVNQGEADPVAAAAAGLELFDVHALVTADPGRRMGSTMNDLDEYKHILVRYRKRWTHLGTVPLVIAWCVEIIAFATRSWEEALAVDLLTHALLLSPVWVWTLARSELRRATLLLAAGSGSAGSVYRDHPEAQNAPGSGWREAVLATGAFPWWGIAMAGIYGLIDLTVCSPLLRPLGYLALILAPILFVAGRASAIFWWFVQLYRDASLVAIIEDRKKGMSEVVLRGVHDTWLGSIVGADPDTGKLRIEILGNVERWDLVSPSRDRFVALVQGRV